jgi:hypothetical protein
VGAGLSYFHHPTLEPLLLNPGDAFGIELIALDLPEPVNSSLAVNGRIVGVKDIEFSVRPPNGRIQYGLARVYNTEAMIMIPVGTLACFLLLGPYASLSQLTKTSSSVI